MAKIVTLPLIGRALSDLACFTGVVLSHLFVHVGISVALKARTYTASTLRTHLLRHETPSEELAQACETRPVVEHASDDGHAAHHARADQDDRRQGERPAPRRRSRRHIGEARDDRGPSQSARASTDRRSGAEAVLHPRGAV